MCKVNRITLLAVLSAAILGCDNDQSLPRYELRWCGHGQHDCVLTQSEGAYVKGGYFYSLDHCNDEIQHLSFYGNKVGGRCIELPESERLSLRNGKG